MDEQPTTAPAAAAQAASKPTRPRMTLKRFNAIQRLAATMRENGKTDARKGRGTFWGSHPDDAADARTFVEWADGLKAWRESR